MGLRQKVAQLGLKKCTALCVAGVFGGEVQGQGAQGIDQSKVAHVPPKISFHPNDAHHQFGGHTVGLLGPLQCAVVLLPKRQASGYAARFHKARSIGLPVFGAGGGRWQDQCRQAVQARSVGNLAAHPWQWQLVGLGQSLGQGLYFGGVAMGRGLGRFGAVLRFARFGSPLLLRRSGRLGRVVFCLGRRPRGRAQRHHQHGKPCPPRRCQVALRHRDPAKQAFHPRPGLLHRAIGAGTH